MSLEQSLAALQEEIHQSREEIRQSREEVRQSREEVDQRLEAAIAEVKREVNAAQEEMSVDVVKRIGIRATNFGRKGTRTNTSSTAALKKPSVPLEPS